MVEGFISNRDQNIGRFASLRQVAVRFAVQMKTLSNPSLAPAVLQLDLSTLETKWKVETRKDGNHEPNSWPHRIISLSHNVCGFGKAS